MKIGTSNKLSVVMVASLMILSSFIIIASDKVIAEVSGDFEYSIIGDHATITGYIGAGGDVSIPSTIDGYSVVAIGEQAFMMNNNLTSLIIPDEIKVIDTSAFEQCTTLTSVTFGSGVLYIGVAAFKYCSALQNVAIPSNVLTIEDLAFRDCSSLGSIEVSLDNPNYASMDGLLYDKSLTTLLACPGGKVGGVVIQDGVTTIGRDALYGCGSVTTIYIPNSVTNIVPDSISYCTSLTAINVGMENPEYASLEGVLYDKDMTDLMVYPSEKDGPFTVRESVTQIQDFAFFSCKKLTSLTIGEGVVNIGSSAFAYCTALSSVSMGANIKMIGGNAFEGCSVLTSIEIPSKVWLLGDNVFGSCSSLTSISVSNDNLNFKSVDGLLYDKTEMTLYQCPIAKAGNISLPDSLSEIRLGAFGGCDLITSVTIPDSVVETIDFSGCTGLKTISFGDGRTSIPSYSFTGCINLTTIILGKDLAIIGSYAFSGCTSLRAVTIPEKVETIAPSAFEGCHNLTWISFRGALSPTTIGEDWILDTGKGIRGHALTASDFPLPGSDFHGLMMGSVLTSVPSSPNDLAAVRGNMSVYLSWSTPMWEGDSPLSSYRIYRAEAVDGTFELISIQNSLYYIDGDVKSGQDYWYKVSAINNNGEGELTTATHIEIPSDSSGIDIMWLALGALIIIVLMLATVFFIRRKK